MQEERRRAHKRRFIGGGDASSERQHATAHSSRRRRPPGGHGGRQVARLAPRAQCAPDGTLRWRVRSPCVEMRQTLAHHVLADHALFLKTQQLERDLKSRPTHAAAPAAGAEDPVQISKMKEELTMCYK